MVPRASSSNPNVTNPAVPLAANRPSQNIDPYSVADGLNAVNKGMPPPVPVDVPRARGITPSPNSAPVSRRSQRRNAQGRRTRVSTSESNLETTENERLRTVGRNKTPGSRDRRQTSSTVRTRSASRSTPGSQGSETDSRPRRRRATETASRSGSTRSSVSVRSGSRVSGTGSERKSTGASERSISRSGSVRTQTARSTRTEDSSGIRTLDWVPLLVGKESPQYFSEGIQHLEGWISEPNPEYPVEILLGLEYISNVYKLEITVVDHLLPEKIEVRVGRGEQLDRDMTYKSAREAAYELKGTVMFEKPTSKNVDPETKTVFIDYEAQYVWLTIFEPLRNRLNRTNQVRIGSLALYGYPMDKTKYTPLTPGTANTRTQLTTRGSGSSFVSVFSLTNSMGPGDLVGEDDDNAIGVIGNEGFKSFGDNLASDPLVSIRVAKRVLGRRIEKAERRGLDVQATVIQRAIERLNEYETKMLEMKSKMSTALTERDYEEAKKQFLSMIDARDLAFRVIHLDLLLGKEELRSLGVESTWVQ
ncbi:unnamed protein product [Bursaphelenchus xylophilus]|uniref:(pine wood nematode) hypothetical protein n=1 Tax=Bursaphelenchus xylophilus TaxID=6326 RepID=A0A811KKH2_BURXY|nr:unnamed protein product [Bursaphelenchus xylophilus]CAG9098098.1 unnamed protein product [Bursaphelenchus xylophilus]